MSEMLARHFERCPVCGELDADGNEQVCRTARELAREAAAQARNAQQDENREEISRLIRRDR